MDGQSWEHSVLSYTVEGHACVSGLLANTEGSLQGVREDKGLGVRELTLGEVWLVENIHT